ncbi:MAG: hypothetical protein RL593_141, partial [Pseudomonadota bacterium]
MQMTFDKTEICLFLEQIQWFKAYVIQD